MMKSRCEMKRAVGRFLAALLLAVILSPGAVWANEPLRILVLPFYSEEGLDSRAGGAVTNDYRRVMRFINNQLVRHNFEVVNPFAHDASEREYNRVLQRAREDSPLAALEMCKKYGTDAAYIVWLNVKLKKTSDGYCKASARLDGEGYDAAARDLGAGVSKTFKVTRRSCDDAIAEVEKEVGDLVGRKLTAWGRNSSGYAAPRTVTKTAPVTGFAPSRPAPQGGILAKNIRKNENLVNIRLDQVTEHIVAEVFGKVVNTVTGVISAKRYSSSIMPDYPQASFVTWRVSIDQTDPFRLQANIMKMIHDISDAGGTITLKGVPYRYTAAEVDMLKGIRPGDATSLQIQFVLDRELVRDNEFTGRHDAYQAQEKKGFE